MEPEYQLTNNKLVNLNKYEAKDTEKFKLYQHGSPED